MKAKTLEQLKALRAQRPASGGYAEDDPRSNEAVAGRMIDRDPGGRALARQRLQQMRAGQLSTSDEKLARLQQLWNQMRNERPDLFSGVHAHFLPQYDPQWEAIGGAALGRGTSNLNSKAGDKNVWYNTDQFDHLDDATAKFVIAKELGQANERTYIDTPERAAAYQDALGYRGRRPAAGDKWSLLGYQDQVGRPNAQGTTTPQDWYGRDFAQAAGYFPTGENVRFDGPTYDRLQAERVLPRTYPLKQLQRIRALKKF